MRGELRLVGVVLGLSLLTLLIPNASAKLALLTVIAAGFLLAVLTRRPGR